jgi:hypothetical protein
VEINTSQVETNLDGLRPKLIPIPLVKKQFFGRLFERVQSGKKVPEVIQVTRTATANCACLRNNYLQGARTHNE